MKDSTIKIVGEIEVRDLNPYNFHLKNDYMENLLSTGFLLLPIIYEHIGELKIIDAFISNSFMRSKKKIVDDDDKRFTKGLALMVTFPNFNKCAIDVGKTIYNEIDDLPNEAVKIIVDNDEQKMFIGRDYDNTMLIEKSENGTRTVMK